MLNFKNIIWLFFLIFFFLFLLRESISYLDPDFGWHLKAGEEILKTKSLSLKNNYNFSFEDKDWIDHEWLTDVIMFLIYSNLGYFWLNIFFVLIIFSAIIILFDFIPKYLGSDNNHIFFLMLIIGIIGIVASSASFGIRIQEITVLGMLIILRIIDNYGRKREAKILLWLPPVFYMWACLHGGFIIGLFILFFWIIVKIIEYNISRYKFADLIDFSKVINYKQILVFAFFSLLSILATFMTPYGFRLYDLLKDYRSTYYMTHIHEWLPLYFYPFNYWQISYTAIPIFLFIIVLIYSFKKFKKSREGQNDIVKNEKYKIRLWELGLFLLFAILTIKARRHLPLFFITTFPFTIRALGIIFPFNKQIHFKDKKIMATTIILLTCSVLILTFQAAGNIKSISNPFSYFKKQYPYSAVKFIKENYAEYRDLNLFNTYDIGGYLIWTLPEKKIFIDGRFPQYPVNGRTFLEEYADFFKKNKIKEQLEKYRIKMALLMKKEKTKLNWIEKHIFRLNENVINKENELIKYLSGSREWKLDYEDKISLIYVKK